MSGNFSDLPSKVIAQLVLDLGLGTQVETNAEWPVFWGGMADSGTHNNAIGITHVPGSMFGFSQHNNEGMEHHGFQVLVRATSEEIGYAKAKAILEAFDKTVKRTTVTVGLNTYIVHSMVRSADVNRLGPEPETRRRKFSLNYTVPMRQS